MQQPQNKPHWLDFTLNVQSLVKWSIGLLIAVLAAWWTLAGRVANLEQHDLDQDARAARLEAALQQQRSDTTQQLHDISGDVKEIRNYLMSKAAGTRPDTQRWAK